MQRLSSGSLDHGLRTDHRGLAWEQVLYQKRVHLGVAVGTAWVCVPYSMQVQAGPISPTVGSTRGLDAIPHQFQEPLLNDGGPRVTLR